MLDTTRADGRKSIRWCRIAHDTMTRRTTWLDAIRRPGARATGVAVLVVCLLIAYRAILFVAFEQAGFDSDQATFGLMAKHISQGRAFPVYPYGESYMLAVESWFVAPFFLVFGVSVASLKLPLLVLNMLIGILLFAGLVRESRLPPGTASIAALFFVLPAPAIAAGLVNSGGGNIEPFLASLLLWFTRARPLAFGVILAVGLLNREFTAYALAALLVLDALDRSMFTRAYVQTKAVALVAFGATWQLVAGLRPFASVYGPGTSVLTLPPPTADTLGARACVDVATLPERLVHLFGGYLGTIVGGQTIPAHELLVNSTLDLGVPGLWWIVGGLLLLSVGRVGWRTAVDGVRPWHGRSKFAMYLFLVGLQAAVFYAVSRCGPLHFATLRYVLLVVFGLSGLTACHLTLEPSRTFRALALAAPLLLAVGAGITHARLLVEYVQSPPMPTRRVLANYLVDHGIRFGHAPFWEAYHINFLTNERVRLASSVPRILEYQWLFEGHPDEAVIIQYRSCEGGVRVADAYYVCAPLGPSATAPDGGPRATTTGGPDPEAP